MNPTAYTINIWAWLKNSSYVVAFVSGLAYLNITPISVFVLTILILTDVVTGIIKSGFIYGGESIKSSIMERGIIAKGLIILIPLLIAGAGKGVGIELGDVAQGIITVLIFSELYSILGNINATRTGKDSQEFDAIGWVIAGLKNVLKNVIKDESL
jgi:hypothetical protein